MNTRNAREKLKLNYKLAWGGGVITATGNINRDYEVLGVVHATASRPYKQAGCSGKGGGLPIQEAYEAATGSLEAAAEASGGNGVIHIAYDYRVSTTALGCSNTVPVMEVYAWGTAIKIKE